MEYFKDKESKKNFILELFQNGIQYLTLNGNNLKALRNEYRNHEHETFNFRENRYDYLLPSLYPGAAGGVKELGDLLIAYELSQDLKNELEFYDLICFILFEKSDTEFLKKKYGTEIIKFSKDEKLKDIIIYRLAIIQKIKKIIFRNCLSDSIKSHIKGFNTGQEYYDLLSRHCDLDSYHIKELKIYYQDTNETNSNKCLELIFTGYCRTFNDVSGIREEIYNNVSVKIRIIGIQFLSINNHENKACMPLIYSENEIYENETKNDYLFFIIRDYHGGTLLYAIAEQIEFLDGKRNTEVYI